MPSRSIRIALGAGIFVGLCAFAAPIPLLVEISLPRSIPADRLQGVELYFGDQAPAFATVPIGPVASARVDIPRTRELGVLSTGRPIRGTCDDVLAAAAVDLAAIARAQGADAVLAVHSPESNSKFPTYVCATNQSIKDRDPATNRLPQSVALVGTAVKRR
ncbi:hypothetical protein BH11PSE2_BH11PSE2_18720 [soil metagenome]